MKSPKTILRARAAGPVAAIFMSSLVHGQSSIPSTNGIHAIVGARIEVGDGHVIEKGTVVVRDGMIVAVASDAAVPRGADVVDGKGLTIYPGFIDAYTIKGYTVPKVSPQPDSDPSTGDYASAFMRETVRRGIHPEGRAIESLALTDDFLKPYQTAGFSTVLIAPSGADMSGAAALINLSGRPLRESAMLANVGQVIGFGNRGFVFGGGYPSSLMGHIAQLRQTLLDAQWFNAVLRSFEAGGIQRPPSDDSLIALQTLIAGKTPALFDADNEFEIERSLDISTEFRLKPIIAGGAEAWKRIPNLKRAEALVLLALAFGREPGSKSETPTPPPGTPPSKEAAPVESPSEPPNPAKVAEQLRLYKETLQNAATLNKAGIPFALSTKGTKSPSDFMDNLRKAVSAGYPRDAALRALTIDAAKIFGVDRQIGSVEVGKTANLVVMTGDFLDAKTKVKVLYIDGRKIDPTRKPIPPTPHFDFGTEGGNS